jgi:hypothetical protein
MLPHGFHIGLKRIAFTAAARASFAHEPMRYANALKKPAPLI